MHTGPRTAVLAVRCSGSSAARTASAAPTGGPTWEPGEVTRACLQADAGHRPRDWKGTHPVPVDSVSIEHDPTASDLVRPVNGGNQTLPTGVFADGTALTNPSLAKVTGHL